MDEEYEDGYDWDDSDTYPCGCCKCCGCDCWAYDDEYEEDD